MPGGSASYASSEKTTSPKRPPLRESAASVPPIREYVSEEMLAERSSTTIVSACAGSGTIVRVCGLRERSSDRDDRGDARDGERGAHRAASGAPAGAKAGASASGIALTVPPRARSRSTSSSSCPAAGVGADQARSLAAPARRPSRGPRSRASSAERAAAVRRRPRLAPRARAGARARARRAPRDRARRRGAPQRLRSRRARRRRRRAATASTSRSRASVAGAIAVRRRGAASCRRGTAAGSGEVGGVDAAADVAAAATPSTRAQRSPPRRGDRRDRRAAGASFASPLGATHALVEARAGRSHDDDRRDRPRVVRDVTAARRAASAVRSSSLSCSVARPNARRGRAARRRARDAVAELTVGGLERRVHDERRVGGDAGAERVRPSSSTPATAAAATTIAGRDDAPHRAHLPPPPLLGPVEERAVDRRAGRSSPITTGAGRATSSSASSARVALLVRVAPPAPASRRGSGGRARRVPVRGSATGTATPPTSREALLPHRILDHDGHDVPAVPGRVEPRLRRRRREEVGEDEDEAAARAGRSRCRPRNVERALEVSSGASNGVASPSRSAISHGRSRRPAAATTARRRRSRAAAMSRARRGRAGDDRQRRLRRSASRFDEPRAAAAGRGPSPGGGRRRSRRAAPRRRRGRGRRTRRRRDAAESRAVANQSIVETGSPGSYGREPITSLPWPRRRLGRSPNGRPVRRRRGTSGNVRRSRTGHRCSRVPVRGGRRRELEAAVADRRSASSRPSPRVSARNDAVRNRRWPSTGRNSRSTSSGTTWSRPCSSAHARAVRSSVRLPRTDAPIATPSASRVARTSSTVQRSSELVDVDVLDGALQRAHARRRRRPASARRSDGRGAARARSRPPRPRPGSRGPARSAKRSSCASGSGNVPSCSIGFSVARTRNGDGSGRVTPSTVTCRSAIASSSADCVLGIARLISSTSTTFAKIGAGPELELARLLVEDREPGHVGRLEIGRALDAREARAVDRLRERAGEDRLRRAGHVLEQNVAAGDERGEDERDLLVLADDDALDVFEQAAGRFVDRVLVVDRLRPGRMSHVARTL